MKKVLLILILSFCLVTPHVSAQGNPWEQRVFKSESSIAFDDFVVKNAKWIENNEISTRLLGYLACKDSKNQEYLKKYLSLENQKEDNCVTAFVAFNSMGVYDERTDTFTPHKTISLSDFRKIGQKEGFWLPYELDLITAEAERILNDNGKKKIELPASFAE